MTMLFNFTIIFLYLLNLTHKNYGYYCFNDIMNKISNAKADEEPERACGIIEERANKAINELKKSVGGKTKGIYIDGCILGCNKDKTNDYDIKFHSSASEGPIKGIKALKLIDTVHSSIDNKTEKVVLKNFYATFVVDGNDAYPYFIIEHNCQDKHDKIHHIFKLHFVNDDDYDPGIFFYKNIRIKPCDMDNGVSCIEKSKDVSEAGKAKILGESIWDHDEQSMKGNEFPVKKYRDD